MGTAKELHKYVSVCVSVWLTQKDGKQSGKWTIAHIMFVLYVINNSGQLWTLLFPSVTVIYSGKTDPNPQVHSRVLLLSGRRVHYNIL